MRDRAKTHRHRRRRLEPRSRQRAGRSQRGQVVAQKQRRAAGPAGAPIVSGPATFHDRSLDAPFTAIEGTAEGGSAGRTGDDRLCCDVADDDGTRSDLCADDDPFLHDDGRADRCPGMHQSLGAQSQGADPGIDAPA